MKKFTNFDKKGVVKENKIFEKYKGKTLDLLNEDVSEREPIVKFFSKLFESKEMAHVYHLTVSGEMGSGHAHIALQDYYEGSIDLIDELIECYMGQYDIVEGYDIIDTSDSKKLDPLDYFTDLGKWIKDNKSVIDDSDTHLHSLVDDILLLVYKTCYKLKFIK